MDLNFLSFSFFFFRKERFHIKPVICHSLKALSSQLTIQTLFIIAEPLKRTHPVLTHWKDKWVVWCLDTAVLFFAAAVLVTVNTWVAPSLDGSGDLTVKPFIFCIGSLFAVNIPYAVVDQA